MSWRRWERSKYDGGRWQSWQDAQDDWQYDGGRWQSWQDWQDGNWQDAQDGWQDAHAGSSAVVGPSGSAESLDVVEQAPKIEIAPGDEEELQMYVRLWPRDSFSPESSWRLHVVYTEKAGNTVDATFMLPCAQQARVVFTVTGCNSKEDAANSVGQQAIEFVRKHQLSNDEPSVGEAQMELHDSQAPPHSMVHGLDLADESVAWKRENLVFLKLTLFTKADDGTRSEETEFGLVVARQVKDGDADDFATAWELPLPDQRVVRIARLEDDVLLSRSLEDAAADFRQYHRSVLRDSTYLEEKDAEAPSLHDEEFALLMCLKYDGNWSADWNKMSDQNAYGGHIPFWLLEVVREWKNIYCLQTVFKQFSPVQPTPSRWHLRSAFHKYVFPEHSFVESSNSAAKYEMLKSLGGKHLALMCVTMVYACYPLESDAQLDKRITQILENSHLAGLLTCSRVLALVDSIKAQRTWRSTEELRQSQADMLKALVGAFYVQSGGGLYSIAQLWSWMNKDRQDESFCKCFDKLANVFFSGPWKMHNRTCTYTCFWEEFVDGEDVFIMEFLEGQAKWYTAFRRARPGLRPYPGEKLVEDFARLADEHGWNRTYYDAKQRGYISRVLPNMHDNPDVSAVLPNKVMLWLGFAPIRSLGKVKTYKGTTPLCTAMQEWDDDRLLVTYVSEGRFEYVCSCDGKLGREKRLSDGSVKPLRWSEADKTLLSPHVGKPVPNQVVGWAFRWQSLPSLTTCSHKESQAQADALNGVEIWEASSVEIWEEDDTHVKWHVGRETLSCETLMTNRGYVYSFCDGVNKSRPLVWMNASAKWVAQDAHGERHLPIAVQRWLNDSSKRFVAQSHSWLANTAPTFQANTCDLLKNHLPRNAFPTCVDLVKVQQAVNHDFNNPVLLYTAFNHSGDGCSMFPFNHRLAVIGSYALEALVAAKLTENSLSQSCGDNFTGPGHVEADLPFFDNMPINKPGALDRCIDASCNHVACAVTCVRLKLHKNLKLADTDLVRQSVVKFEQLVAAVDRMTDDSQDRWSHLVHHDAPRILGDVFLAVIGAILLDSNFATLQAELEGVIETHMDECTGAVANTDLTLTRCSEETLSVNEMLEAIRNLKDRSVVGVLAGCPAAPEENIEDAEQSARQVRNTLSLRDVHMFHTLPIDVTNNPSDKVIVAATSPRVAKLKAGYQQIGRVPSEGEIEFGDAPVVENAPAEAETSGIDNNNKAVWCEECEMWLNGPTQWEDHKIGKKHKKNLKKPKSQPQKNTAVAPPPKDQQGRASSHEASSEQTSAPPPASPLMYWPPPPPENFPPQSYAGPRTYDPSAYAYPALLHKFF